VRQDLRFIVIWAMVLALLMLTACGGITATPSTQGDGMQLLNSTQIGVSCEACDQATFVAALTQEQNYVDNQAAATAEIVRANAQATLNSANATLSAAQTQEQSNANVIAAQIAATAEMERANAQATLNSAGATQSAALTQDAIQQTQMAAFATTNAEALAIQQNNDELAASTQTAVADNIATQTQAAVATSQWYSDQERQREEQRKGPVAFLWMWCFPVFFLLFAGLVLWGFWRWLKNRQANQYFLENPVDRLPATTIEVAPDQHDDDSMPYLESDVVDDRYQHVKSDDQVRQWLDEVKRKLLNSDKEDEENETDN
jgi:hypothetical protein